MIEDGYTSPTKNADHKIVPKPHFKWDKHKFALANLNSKAISCIINGLTFNEFHKVINITCAKGIRNCLEVSHEGPIKLKIVKLICLLKILKILDYYLMNLLMIFLTGSKVLPTIFNLEKILLVLK